MHTKILVPLDGSEVSEKALEQARKMAYSDQVEVRLLVAWEPSAPFSPPPGSPDFNDVKDYYHHYLQEWSNKLTQDGVRASHVLVEGKPETAILGVAREEGVDLIVMTSHGRSGLKRLVLGSVAEQVVREAPCPVLVLGHEYLNSLSWSDLNSTQ